ncbi:MAG TPA: GvpL/GvpF family gas vesicle protein [Gemmatimonadaceae bacterium]|nr:GvpL/GvpF family gas vesicle protein [Gemmatimonadaceae bacterium]
MPSYLHGLLLSRNVHALPRHVRGVANAPVRAIECGGLAALVGDVGATPEAALDGVRAHDAALQAVIDARVTVAAARFGQTFTTSADVCTHLERVGARVQRVLEEFDGCGEMRLLMHDTAALDPAATTSRLDDAASPGRAYLEHLRSRVLPALRLAPALGPVVRAERVARMPRGSGAVFAHLVEFGSVDDYRSAVAAVPALAEARLVGPVALYSFAEPEL